MIWFFCLSHSAYYLMLCYSFFVTEICAERAVEIFLLCTLPQSKGIGKINLIILPWEFLRRYPRVGEIIGNHWHAVGVRRANQRLRSTICQCCWRTVAMKHNGNIINHHPQQRTGIWLVKLKSVHQDLFLLGVVTSNCFRDGLRFNGCVFGWILW